MSEEENKKTAYDKLVDWFDIKLGFTKTPLRPIPDFTLNPIYWLGLLLAVTFAFQALTGIFMLIYYVPTPAQAYSSTQYIISSVPLGHLIETLHLYTAYAMIFLTFLHLARNFFGSAHKGDRDLMWLTGFVLFVIVIAFGYTGYLLPWTVVSKSATDVGLGFIGFFPAGLANIGSYILVGAGTYASEITNFLHIHTVFLPLALIVFLALKIYMYEVHGPAYVPAYGKPGKGKIYKWFPKIFLYFVMLTAVYLAILLAWAALFPLVLPPVYSASTAGSIVVQPDWYLLGIYQLLKIQIFEGRAQYVLYSLIAFGAILFLLPFYDRSKRREISQRPLYTTIGAILIIELITLTIWGHYTPGTVIPTYQAGLLLGGIAAATAVALGLVYRLRGRKKTAVANPLTPSTAHNQPQPQTSASTPSEITIQTRERFAKNVKYAGRSLFNRFTAIFIIFLAIASSSLASVVNMLPTISVNAPFFAIAISALIVSSFFLCLMLRSFVLAYEGAITKR